MNTSLATGKSAHLFLPVEQLLRLLGAEFYVDGCRILPKSVRDVKSGQSET